MIENEEFKKDLIEIIEKYKKDHQPISIAVKDIACRYNVSVHHIYNYIDLYLKESDGGHMDFKGNKDISSEYVEQRFKGK